MEGRDEGGEEGARVGEEAASEGAGIAEGSNSRSGTGGAMRGRLVILRIVKRKRALRGGRVGNGMQFVFRFAHFMISISTTALQRALSEDFRLRPISTTSSTKRINSRERAAHLYVKLESDQARV